MKSIERLDKLLRHAESAAECGNQAEAEAFLAQAQTLAAKYHLELKISGTSEEAVHLARESDIVLGGWRMRRYRWKLAWAVARAHGCVPWVQERYSVELPTDGKNGFSIDRAIRAAWSDADDRRRAQGRLVETESGWELELSTLYAPVLAAGHVEAAARAGLRRPGFEFGTEERPELDNIDTTDGWAECELCCKPIYGGEPVYSIGPRHWACHDAECEERWPYVPIRGAVRRESMLVMVGLSNIADAAIYVYRVVLREVDRLAKSIARGKGRTAMNSARLGIVAGLASRLRTEQHAALPAGPDAPAEPTSEASLATVLDDAIDDTKRWLASAYGRSPFGAARSGDISLDHDTYRAGVEAASSVELPDPNSSRAALSHGSRALKS